MALENLHVTNLAGRALIHPAIAPLAQVFQATRADGTVLGATVVRLTGEVAG